MALTDAQKADVRRYAGYPALGDMPTDDSRDYAYGFVSPGVLQTLFHRLNALRPEEETVLINTYLTPLGNLESDIPGARQNLDTAQAAVWKHNAAEIDDRIRLFDEWRRRMCAFIGIPAGPWLTGGNASGGSVRIQRA